MIEPGHAKRLKTRTMTPPETAPTRTLLQTIEDLADRAPASGFSLGEIIEELDESAFGAGLFLLALPCCIPFLYGVPQLVSLPMMALAVQMVLGHQKPWMPRRFAGRMIDRKGLIGTARGGRKWLGWVERFSRPRLQFITGPRFERLMGLFLMLFCASILVPLPLTNTVPGLAVALTAFGMINRDGLLVVLGLAAGVGWIALLIMAPLLGLQLLASP